ncbi:MAG: hypothetical protein V1800_17270, partial [Candidatus Latescibacterota bacterium]
MNIARYLSFEINRTCDMGIQHAKFCPNQHPERYRYSLSKIPLNDDLIFEFWDWCVTAHHFRGIVTWSGYNEPTLVLDRIHKIMERMRAIDPWQPFQIVTNRQDGAFPAFDIVKRSQYGDDPVKRSCDDGVTQLDNRIASAYGEGKPYDQAPQTGRCARGLGWEVTIDHWGNWCLCCNDWRCEESVGSIANESWDELFLRWKEKSRLIEWKNREEYERLPRMCRSCIDVNPGLHITRGM